MKELANRLIDFRARHNLTQQETAKLCGISTRTLLMIESGKYVTKPVTARKIEIMLEEHKDE